MAATYDPAAYFFEREQNELGDLQGELGLNDEPSSNIHEPSGDSHYPQVIQTAPVEEPETVRKWKREFRERIEAKDQEESRKRAEMEQISAQQICDWRRHYAEQMEKTWANNRDYDRQLRAQREEALRRNQSVDPLEANKVAAQCSTWEQVCLLCDFSAPKTVKSSTIVGSVSGVASSSKDVSRMRSLLLQLKTQPLVR